VRVLLVSGHGADTTYGGAERYVADLAVGLLERGFEPHVLSAFPTRTSPAGVPTTALHATDWRTSGGRRFRNHAGDVLSIPGPRLERAVRAARPDLVHTNNLPGISSAVWECARRAGARVVHTMHDYHLLCPRTTLRTRHGALCRPNPLLCGLRAKRLARWGGAVSSVVAGSEHLLAVHRNVFEAAVRRVIRLPIVPPTSEPIAPPTEPKTLGYLGGLNAIKGVPALLDAAPTLARDGYVLRVAGDGQLRAAVEAAAARGDLVYDGFVDGDGKRAFIAGCDVGLVPSWWDEPSGPPYVVCEWLGAARPVLATRRGGLAETVDVVGGVFAFEATAEGVLEAVRHLRSPAAWDAAVAAAARSAGTDDRERWLDEHEEVYRAALGLAAAPAVSTS
jgi:glycosyltransferase involved in cell wall biosynthesis